MQLPVMRHHSSSSSSSMLLCHYARHYAGCRRSQLSLGLAGASRMLPASAFEHLLQKISLI
jgi:hypothetical protein